MMVAVIPKWYYFLVFQFQQWISVSVVIPRRYYYKKQCSFFYICKLCFLAYENRSTRTYQMVIPESHYCCFSNTKSVLLSNPWFRTNNGISYKTVFMLVIPKRYYLNIHVSEPFANFFFYTCKTLFPAVWLNL